MTTDMKPACKNEPKPGWYARLQGNEIDLKCWRRSLNEPFDPVAIKLPDGQTALRSIDFEELHDASEVRERALILIGRLNGALSLWNGARSVTFGGIVKIDETGKQHTWIFAEAAALEMRIDVMSAALVSIGSDGKPLPPSPPTPSQPQDWNRLAQENDDVSDLLDHFGGADNWFDIYKTIEYAGIVVGSPRKLEKLVDKSIDANNLKRNANFYRHARQVKYPRPEKVISLKEAGPMLAIVVRTALSFIVSNPEQPD